MIPARLTNLQQELLKIFSIELSDKELLEIKHLLATHFASKASDEMDRLWETNQRNQETMETWLAELPRLNKG
jgi:hypothetical protein